MHQVNKYKRSLLRSLRGVPSLGLRILPIIWKLVCLKASGCCALGLKEGKMVLAHPAATLCKFKAALGKLGMPLCHGYVVAVKCQMVYALPCTSDQIILDHAGA